MGRPTRSSNKDRPSQGRWRSGFSQRCAALQVKSKKEVWPGLVRADWEGESDPGLDPHLSEHLALQAGTCMERGGRAGAFWNTFQEKGLPIFPRSTWKAGPRPVMANP